MNNGWAVSIDLTDAYLLILIHPQSRKYLRFVYKDQIFQFTALPCGMYLSAWIFTKLMDVIASHLHKHAISVFLYLDDRLVRDLIGNQLLYQTEYCLQVVQYSLPFHKLYVTYMATEFQISLILYKVFIALFFPFICHHFL